MIFEAFPVGSLECNCIILGDESTREAIVIDGGDGVDDVMERLKRMNLRATHLVHTHAHIDHIGDLGRLRDLTGAKAGLHPADLPLYQTLPIQAHWIGLPVAPAIVDLDFALEDRQTIEAGEVSTQVLHTPGHTPGSVCFAFEQDGKTIVLSGDTLFAGSIGRWDLGGTSMEDIVASIKRKLFPLPDSSLVIPGHGPSTTIGFERTNNPYLQ